MAEQTQVFEQIKQANDCIAGATTTWNDRLDTAGEWYDLCQLSNPCP
ncbi:MAG TPA: hypothetical protein VNI52_12060 [Sphingobacteriaceae bacterium]|nr:hypothetical protein [Sphingobacteriaceae bacterium]